MKVFLTGFSGSGKSTVGPKLAHLLKCTYIDCDHEIERNAGIEIPEIFATRGERYFRQLEHDIIRRYTKDTVTEAIIGLGGGAFTFTRNRRLIQKAGVTVYLRCEVNELYRRLCKLNDRPLLSGKDTSRKAVIERMRHLLGKRKRFYEMSDIVISTSHLTPARTAREIKQFLKKYGQ